MVVVQKLSFDFSLMAITNELLELDRRILVWRHIIKK
jgi:hypothetical protein